MLKKSNREVHEQSNRQSTHTKPCCVSHCVVKRRAEGNLPLQGDKGILYGMGTRVTHAG